MWSDWSVSIIRRTNVHLVTARMLKYCARKKALWGSRTSESPSGNFSIGTRCAYHASSCLWSSKAMTGAKTVPVPVPMPCQPNLNRERWLFNGTHHYIEPMPSRGKLACAAQLHWRRNSFRGLHSRWRAVALFPTVPTS